MLHKSIIIILNIFKEEKMQLLLYVAIGGALGSVSRYVMAQIIPLNATIFINIIGSLLLGIFVFIATIKLPTIYLAKYTALLAYGFCGGFTTFSTFSLENFKLINEGQFYIAIINIITSVIFSILAIWLVYFISKRL